jgi:hypothetical protein
MDLEAKQLTSWEMEFLESIDTYLDAEKELSERQYEVLQSMFRDKIQNVI